MIVSEYRQSEHFDRIENELVTRLDSLFMSDSKGDDISRAFFIGQLRHLFDTSDVEDQLRDRVSAFLDSVDLFLELLLSVRALPEGEEYADDRVIATVSILHILHRLHTSHLIFHQLRLMNFIRRIGRDEIYIKYVHQLVNVCMEQALFFANWSHCISDASPNSKLCRSSFDLKVAFRPSRMESQHVCWPNGRSGSASAITLPQKRNSVFVNSQLPWCVLDSILNIHSPYSVI
jgi:hypothetical protein